MITEQEWLNLYDNFQYLMDACDEREKEEIEKNGDISPYPRVTIYWREDGIFFQFVIDEYRLVFKLDRDKTWKIWGSRSIEDNISPPRLDSEDIKVIYEGAAYRRKMI